MARRKKPCEYCEGDYFNEDMNVDGRHGFCMWFEWYPLNDGLLSVFAQAKDDSGEVQEATIDFSFNYCPMCGRKLTED